MHWPVRTAYIQPCHGHARRVPESLPSLSGPPLWAQTSPSACTRSPTRTRTRRAPSASTSIGRPTATSASGTRMAVTRPLQHVGAVQPAHVLPAHLGRLPHLLQRLRAPLGRVRVALDDLVAALAVDLVGLDVDGEELHLVVVEAVLRLERRQIALVDARHLRLQSDEQPGR